MMLSMEDMEREAGCTYRQLDYWIRSGYVRPHVGARGAGTKRRFTPVQVPVVRLLTALSDMGACGDVLERAGAYAERQGLEDRRRVVVRADGTLGPLGDDDAYVVRVDRPVRRRRGAARIPA